jgi:hypothetical protein
MTHNRRTRLRALATLVAAGAAATFACGTPAHADSTAGGPITRSEVLTRAQSWVDAGVPYNQAGYYGGYREDCSGYVSMAWHLTSSLVTQTLPDVSTKESFSALAPGDILDYTAEHTFLFAGWTNKSTGAFKYYADSNPSDPTHGPTAGNVNNSTMEGWPTGYYDAYRYDKIVDDTPVTPHGTVWDRTRSAAGSWQSSADEIDSNGAITAVAAAALPNGTLHVETVVPGSGLWDRTRSANGTWSAATHIDTNGNITAVAAAALPDGTLHVESVVPGSGVWDRTRSASGTWASSSTHIDTNGNISAVAAAGLPDGTVHVDSLVPGAGVWDRTRSASGTWAAASTQLDDNGSISALSSAALPDGTLHVETVVPGSGVWDRTRSTSGSWSTATDIDSNDDIFDTFTAGLPDGSMHVGTIA